MTWFTKVCIINSLFSWCQFGGLRKEAIVLLLGYGKEGSGSGLGREYHVLPGLAGTLSDSCRSLRTVMCARVGFCAAECGILSRGV